MKITVPYLPNLTPVRGIAALLVAVYHFEGLTGRFVQTEQSLFIRKSYLFVDLFFVMSGFVMFHVYGGSFRTKITWKAFRMFMLARFARLYPLHLFTLVVLVVVYYATNGKPDPINNPAAIPTHLLLLQSFGIHSIFTWNVPSWSISAEWWAYVVFPALVLLLGRAKIGAGIGLVLLVGLAYWAIEYSLPRSNPFAPGIPVPHDLQEVTYDYGFLRGLAGFIIGMLTYQLYANSRIRLIAGRDSVGLLVLVATVYLLHSGINDALYTPIFAGLVLCIAANQRRIRAFCSYRPLQYLGDISYSIYLMHRLLIFWLVVPVLTLRGYAYKGPGSIHFSFTTGLLYCLAYLIAVVAVSSLTYRFLEVPARNYINHRFGHRRQAYPADSVVTGVPQLKS